MVRHFFLDLKIHVLLPSAREIKTVFLYTFKSVFGLKLVLPNRSLPFQKDFILKTG